MLECLHKPRLFFVIDLLLFTKLLEFLVINHSLSERRMLKFSHVLVIFITCMGMLFPAVDWIMQSGLAFFPGSQGSCGIFPKGPTSWIVSFNIHKGLKC